MATTASGQQIATPRSDHVAPGPMVAISNTPPLPPGPGPVPAPFLYVALSSTAKDTNDRLTVGGQPVLVNDSFMKIEPPGNIMARPCEQTVGADIITRQTNDTGSIIGGFTSVQVGQKYVAGTTTKVSMNVTEHGTVSQLQSALIRGVDMRAPGFNAAAAAAVLVGVVDPVSAATGHVIDAYQDLSLRGLFPVVWKRTYSSSRAAERTPLGIGGWTHSLHQWIDVSSGELVYRNAEGADVTVDLPEIGAISFHRGLRIEIRRRKDAVFEVYSLETRLVHRFEPLAPGGRAALRSIRDAWDQGVELMYSGQRLVRVVGRGGREIRVAYDPGDRVSKVELWARGGPWKVVSYGYGEEGELSRVEGVGGAVDAYFYDGAHRMVKKTLPTGLSFHYAYDDRGRCVHAWGDGQIHEGRFEYDDEAGTTTMTGNPEARVFHRDERGAITAIEPVDGSGAQHVRYDDDLLVIGLSDPTGKGMAFEYDARGNLTKIAGPGGLGPAYEYKDDLQIKRTEVGGAVTEYAYDARGALIASVGPNGLRTTMEYDEVGRVTAIRSPSEALGLFTYDEEDNLVSESGPGGRTYRYTHDALGYILSATDPLGRTTKYGLDAEGRVAAITQPDGAVLRTGYDALGRLERETDASGAETRLVYAGIKSIVEHQLPDGTRWKTRHDRAERPRQITNARGETWEWSYDRAGNVVEERAFDGRILRYGHAPSAHLSRIDHPDGTWRTFAKDLHGHTLVERSSHGTLRFERDAMDRITRCVVEDAKGELAVSMKYDARGRLVEETQDGLTMHYSYSGDGHGPLAQLILPGGETTRFDHDSAGRLVLVDHEGRKLRFAYDGVDREVRRTFEPAGVDLSTERDVLDRTTRQLVLGPEVRGKARPTLIDRAYTYDVVGRRRSMTDSVLGVTTYEHDVLGQLASVRSARGEEWYDHDPVGSVTAVRGSGRSGAAPWSLGPGNVLLQAGDTEFTYDEMRRRTRRRVRRPGKPPETTEYRWDCRNRLREIVWPDGSRVVYSYDAIGRRLRKDFYSPPVAGAATDPARTVRYVWQGPRIAAEIDSARGTRVIVYAPGTYLPLMEAQAGAVFAHVTDPLGAPLELIDEKGRVAWRSGRNAWGAPRGDACSDIGTPLSLLGQYLDDETGFAYVWNRYFDPATLRWITPDPLGLEGGRNTASFNGSPVTHVDPDGLEARCLIGRPANDLAFRSVAGVPPGVGRAEIAIHGYPYHVLFVDRNGNQYIMNARQFADWYRNSSGQFQPGRPIVLISCYTGQYANGFAAQLANELGVQVTAPSHQIAPTTWGPGAGGMQILLQNNDPFVPANAPGRWTTFQPSSSQPGLPMTPGGIPEPGTAPFPGVGVGMPSPAPAAGSRAYSPYGRSDTPAAVPAPLPPAAPAGGAPAAGGTGPMPAVPTPPAGGAPAAGGTGPMPAVPAPPAGGTVPGTTAPPQPAGGNSGLPFQSPSGSGSGGSGSGGSTP